jgi:ATP-binding cassette, subfamily B, bacterial PglK
VNTKTFKLFQNLWCFINAKRRKQLYFLFSLTIVSAISEILCLGSILPFIGIITNPDKVFSSPIMSGFINILNIQKASELILPLTIAFASFALIAGTLRLLLILISLRVANATGTDLGIDIYRKTLYQPYSTHISRHSSEIISTIAQKSITATTVIVSLVTICTTFTLFSAIVITMLYINPKITIFSTILVIVAYGAITIFTKKNLSQNGQIMADKQNDVMRKLQEGLGAIRDVLLDGTQENHTQSYSHSAQQLQKSRAENMFINQAPRYFIETFAMILIALFVLVSSYQTNSIIDILPTIGFFAISAQRLLPLMQQMYGYWSEIIGNKASLVDVLELLDQPLPENVDQPEPDPLIFANEIKLTNVSFKYSNTSMLILNKVNLSIPKGARVGIIGNTGSGKSTVLDILMGLIKPTDGTLSIDGKRIDSKNQRSWQRAIAHVPQVIFLANLTISENIAFGVPLDEIDHNRVREAAIRANADEFISKCDKGYETYVGERGIRLSGGQRQRIGIARALYKKANVLCFDEATSALDNKTEQEVIDAINNLDKNITVIMIAHRLTTIKKCTHFIKLEHGSINNIKSYETVAVEQSS